MRTPLVNLSLVCTAGGPACKQTSNTMSQRCLIVFCLDDSLTSRLETINAFTRSYRSFLLTGECSNRPALQKPPPFLHVLLIIESANDGGEWGVI